MRFAAPHFFWLLCMIPLFIGFFLWAYQRKQARISQFISHAMIGKLVPGTGLNRQIAKWILFLVFYCFIVISLTRPQFGVKTEVVEAKGVDVMIALDISQSMLAEDISPNRIERAKFEIGKFIDLLKGDRVGLIVFAGESFVQCPLTLDYGAAKMYLSVVNTGWIQLQGTAIADAIKQAVNAFKSDAKKYKVLLILSDGEDHEGDAEAMAQLAKKNGIIIHTIGVGSEKGVPIPLKKKDESVVYKKDEKDNVVMTRLDPAILQKISSITGGSFMQSSATLDLSQIYQEIDKMEKKDLGMNKVAVYEDRYQIFLLLAILFFILEFMINERTMKMHEWRGRFE